MEPISIIISIVKAIFGVVFGFFVGAIVLLTVTERFDMVIGTILLG